MKIGTKLSLAVSILLLFALFTGCAPQATTPTTEAPIEQAEEPATPTEAETPSEPSAQTFVVGVSLGEMGDVFDRVLYDAMIRYFDETPDIEGQILNARSDVNQQLTDVETLLNSQVDGVILWPYQSEALSPGTLSLNAAGIPVVCVNTFTTEGEFTYVGSDDVDAGRIQGHWLADNLPEDATFVYLMGPIGHSGQIGRKQGLMEVLEDRRPDITMLAEQSGHWQRDEAMTLATDFLASFPDVTAMVSQNDNMALGIIEALRTAGRMDIIVAGTDATEEACESIAKGEMAMSVFQNADAQGYECARVMHEILKGNWTPGQDMIIPFEAVDDSNVERFAAMYN